MPQKHQLRTPLRNRFSNWLFFLLGLTLPLQLGKHFWPRFSFFSGVRIDYLSPTLFLSDLVLFLTIIFFWRQIWRLGQNLIRRHYLFVGLFLVLLVANFLLAEVKELFAYRLFQYSKIAMTTLLFAGINQKRFQSFLNGLLLSSLLALVLAGLQIIYHTSMQGGWYYLGERSFTINTPGISTVNLAGQKLLRAYSFFSHPNSLAGFYLIVVMMSLIFKKPALTVTSILLVIFSFSKFSLLGLGGLLIAWSIASKQTCRLCRLGGLVLCAWLILFSLLLQNDPQSLISRLNSYKQYVQFITSHPWGLGLGHYLIPNLLPVRQPVHNIFLLITVELGLVIWPFIGYSVKAVAQKLVQKPHYLFLILPVILNGSFDHFILTLNQNLLLLGVVLGIIIGFSPRQKTLS